MPRRKTASLRELRTTEVWLELHRERDRALTNCLEHVRAVLQSGAAPAVVVKQLEQATYEADTALRVAQRMHELRLQELQTITKFPDEGAA